MGKEHAQMYLGTVRYLNSVVQDQCYMTSTYGTSAFIGEE